MAINQDQRLSMFLSYKESLARYFQILVRDPHDAEDLTQELASLILGEANPPDDPDRFGAWCRGAARNLALKHLAKKHRQPTPVESRFFDAVASCTDDFSANEDLWVRRRQALGECLKALPPASRATLAARYGENKTSQEIAERNARSPDAMRMLLFRIRQRLAQCIATRMERESRK